MHRLSRAVFAAFLLVGATSFAGTDYKCMQDCLEQGSLYGYCQRKCSYDDAPPPQVKQTDFQCMQNCMDRGYLYGYCQSRCSF